MSAATAATTTTKRTFSRVDDNTDEKEETADPPTKRARVARVAPAATITTPLAVIFRILHGPQTEHACRIWPIERTGSENVSVTALITCAMYSNISMPKLMKSWERVVTQARAIYDAGGVSNPPTPPPTRAIEIWQKIRDASTYKYVRESPNFLYDLFVHGNCQCSCGSVAMKEILERVDPNLGTMLILEPHHVRVSVEGGGGGDGDVTLLETTSKTVNRETMTYEELWQSKTLIPFVEQDLEACFFGREWLRYLRYRSNEGELGIPAQQQILARVYQGWEDTLGTSAIPWSAAAQMFRKLAHACYLFVGDSHSTQTQQAIQQVRVEAHAAGKVILSAYDLQTNTEPSTQIQKAALYAAWFYKNLFDFAGHMVVVVVVDPTPEP